MFSEVEFLESVYSGVWLVMVQLLIAYSHLESEYFFSLHVVLLLSLPM